jgi:DNA-binding MarR family transcriptional regulator
MLLLQRHKMLAICLIDQVYCKLIQLTDNTMPTITPAMQFCMSISQVNTNIVNAVNASLSCHGISFTELLVLHQLSLAPETTLRRIELAGKVGLSASGITRLLAPLEKIGLIQKEANARDARVSLVKLTQTGQTLLNDALVTFEFRAAQVTNKLTEKQLQQRLDLLNAIISSAN